jgi:hypothetical protein
LVQEGGITMEARRGGGWRFLRPDGREFEIGYREPAPTYEWSALRETHDAHGIHIDADTAATRWRGEQHGLRTRGLDASRPGRTREALGRRLE